MNKARIPEIARYVTGNPDSYVFSALTVAVDADFRFERIGGQSLERRLGVLHIPMSARFVVNDRQHRLAAIIEALKVAQRSGLGDETIGVVLLQDLGLERSQQWFAGLNRHAMRPAPSIAVLYDHREETTAITRHECWQLPVLGELTERGRSSLPRRPAALFTLPRIGCVLRLSRSLRNPAQAWASVGRCPSVTSGAGSCRSGRRVVVCRSARAAGRR